MVSKPDLKSERKILGEILTSARKQPHNFAILMAKRNVVVKANKKTDSHDTQSDHGRRR